MPLEIEHYLIWQLHRQVKTLVQAPSAPGCINDWLFARSATQEELAEVCASLQWQVDGSPMFRLKGGLGDAPPLKWQYRDRPPKFSAWQRKVVTEKLLEVAKIAEKEDYHFGHWSLNGGFKLRREQRHIQEKEGIGREEGDILQQEMAAVIVENRGTYVSGRGGIGKSRMLKLLEPKLKALGYDVHYIAFTHVAAANLDGNTILYELHRYAKKKRLVAIVDECSMVPLGMWAALANLAFARNIVTPTGSMDGQFLPIQHQHRMRSHESDFMHELCNGLHILLNKFRRKDGDRPSDYGHFQSISSICPRYNASLELHLYVAGDVRSQRLDLHRNHALHHASLLASRECRSQQHVGPCRFRVRAGGVRRQE